MILNDYQITKRCPHMIDPFEASSISEGVISYGTSSFGYDIRLGRDYRVFTPNPLISDCVDPKNFNPQLLLEVGDVDYILIPPNSYALGISLEYMRIPVDVMALVLTKSTYARCGIIVNITPLEPGWNGYITIEMSNSTPLPAKIYSGEGIAQVLFFQGEIPLLTYAAKGGKYQDQKEIVLAKVK